MLKDNSIHKGYCIQCGHKITYSKNVKDIYRKFCVQSKRKFNVYYCHSCRSRSREINEKTPLCINCAKKDSKKTFYPF